MAAGVDKFRLPEPLETLLSIIMIIMEIRSAAKQFALAVIAFALLNGFVWSWRENLEQERRDNLLLSSSVQTRGEVRYDWSSGEALGSYLGHIPNARVTRLVAVAGMSQMYAINDRKPGDATIAEHLDDLLRPDDARSFGVAAPNLNNEEALFILETLTSSPETKPSVFVYGVCFDKFRNVDLRPGYQALLRESGSVSSQWSTAARSLASKLPTATRKMTDSLSSALSSPTAQAQAEGSVEDRLRSAAARVFPVVSSRKTVNAFLQRELFLFRNWLFNIKPTSKRPVLASRYEMNWQFLKALARRARENDVQLVLYVIPLNPLADNPYIPRQYDRFKTEVAAFCNTEKIPFANLEDVVPSEHWGEFMGGPDFKHFRGEGHRMTAEAIYSRFRPILTGK